MTEEDKISLIIKLKDGRNLGYADLGDPKGTPLFHFHGYPGSRLEATLVADLIKGKGIRFIAVDRPGMGLSDFKKKRTILDWPDDVVELAEALGYDKFAVQGISGGGPGGVVTERWGCALVRPPSLQSSGLPELAG